MNLLLLMYAHPEATSQLIGLSAFCCAGRCWHRSRIRRAERNRRAR